MLVHIVSSYIVRSHRLYCLRKIMKLQEFPWLMIETIFFLWNIPLSCTFSHWLEPSGWLFQLIKMVRWNHRPCEILWSLENPNSSKLRFFETTTPAINHQPSTTINHHQPPSTTINHHQPPSNHHQPLQVGHGRSQAAENKKVKGLNDVWMPPQMRSTNRNVGKLYTGNRSNGTCFDVSLRHDMYIYMNYLCNNVIWLIWFWITWSICSPIKYINYVYGFLKDVPLKQSGNTSGCVQFTQLAC